MGVLCQADRHAGGWEHTGFGSLKSLFIALETLRKEIIPNVKANVDDYSSPSASSSKSAYQKLTEKKE